MATDEFDEQLDQLEERLRVLKTKYEMFFAGSLKRPPLEDRRRIDGIVAEMSKNHIRDNAKRFRFNTVLSRINQYRERWGRQLREMEEGPLDFRRRKALFGGAPPPAVKPAEPAPRPAPVTSPASDSYVKVTDGSADEAFRTIYSQILEAQKQLGKPSAWTLEQVAAMVEKQAASLRERFRTRTIGFRVETVDGKVKLKARPE